MKARINQTYYSKYTTVCVLVGHYDENGNYCEMVFENMKLKDIHQDITKNIDLNHDITIHVAPGIEVRVFAKSMKNIETYLDIENDPEGMKSMLDCWSKYNKPSTDYVYATIDLEEWKELKKLPPMDL